MEYTIGTKVFHKWTIVGDLGEGANGRVFVIEKDEFGVKTRSALKVIRIPRSQSHVREVMSEGMDEASAALYFREAVDRLLREAAVMASLKAHPHIVGYEDHEVVPQEGGIGWDILIRMELLTPLADHLMGRTMTEGEVLRLGIELTEALVYCQEKDIIHRDIKLSNVLVNEFGQYKLGDFGVARTLDKTRSGLSHSGTVDYMAPEIYYDRPYGPTVDIYSLGLVLYVLMNGNRLPFLPEAPQRIRHGEKEEARERRLRGDSLPSPRYASEAFSCVILRACAHDSRERYRTARELLEALRSVAKGEWEETSSWEEDPRRECSLPDTEEAFEEEPTCSVWGDRDTVGGDKEE